jgi:cytochrome c5
MSRLATVVALLCLLKAGAAGQTPGARSKAVAVPPPAWQTDPALAARWQRFTGGYIYQVACTTCHTWGPEHWGRDQWGDYLRDFPANHQPDIRKTYADLAATMDTGKSMPTRDQQRDSLATFVLAAAPPKARDASLPDQPYEGFPTVGRVAPEFSISDVQGREFSLGSLRGKKHLVLVFSRAHW